MGWATRLIEDVRPEGQEDTDGQEEAAKKPKKQTAKKTEEQTCQNEGGPKEFSFNEGTTNTFDY